MFGNPKVILVDDQDVAPKRDGACFEKFVVENFAIKGHDSDDLLNTLVRVLAGNWGDGNLQQVSAAESTVSISPTLPRKINSSTAVTLCDHSTTYAHNQAHIPAITVNTYPQPRHAPIRPLYPHVQSAPPSQRSLDAV